jgi:hypothetical protein
VMLLSTEMQASIIKIVSSIRQICDRHCMCSAAKGETCRDCSKIGILHDYADPDEGQQKQKDSDASVLHRSQRQESVRFDWQLRLISIQEMRK